MKRHPRCEGRIRRGGSDNRCGNDSTYAIRNETTDAVAGSCRHHLAQVIDAMDTVKALVIPLDHVKERV